MTNATPRLLYPPRKNPVTHCARNWVGPKVGVGCYGKEKITWTPPAFEPAASHYTEDAVLAPNKRQLAPP